MAESLFTLDGPLCAIETNGARQTDPCLKCGRGRRRQVADLSVSLVCQPRHIWLSDGNAILFDQKAIEGLSDIGDIERFSFRPVHSTWREGLPWSNQPTPDLVQLVAENPISASEQSIETEGCACGAVRSISFSPLFILDPGSNSNIWYLAENPEVLVFVAAIRDALIRVDSDLAFLRAWRMSEYTSATTPSDEISWGDL